MKNWTEVTKPTDVVRFHRLLRARLLERTSNGGVCSIGWPKGRFDARIRLAQVSPDKELWIYSGRHEETKDYITLVGRYNPGHKGSLLIDLQFNFPSGRFDRMKGGAFVLDRDGRPWLAHRGIVTKGTARMNKSEIFRCLNWRKPISAESDRRPFAVELLPVAALDDEELVAKVLRFSVAMRDAATLAAGQDAAGNNPSHSEKAKSHAKKTGKPQAPNGLDAVLWDYRDEFAGTVLVNKKGEVIADWKHGRVVRALRDALLEHGTIRKSQAADLIVLRGRKLDLYEVKPSSGSQSIYTAIGQLVFNGASLQRQFSSYDVERFLVLPRSKKHQVRQERCKELGFSLVTFEANGDTFSFTGLPPIPSSSLSAVP